MVLFWPRANTFGAISAMLAGFCADLGAYWYQISKGVDLLGFHPFMWGLFASIVVGTAVTLLTPRQDPNLLRHYFPVIADPRDDSGN